MLGNEARARQRDSVARIQELRRQLSGLVLAPGHDHTEYGSKLAETFQGEPSTSGLDNLRRLATELVDDEGRLRGPGRPTYQPDDSLPAGGTVTFA